MADITYDKISILGMEYSKLINIEMNIRINEHSDATITCEVSEDEAVQLQAAWDDGEYVIISTNNGAENEVLFVGIKYRIEIEDTSGYRIAKLELKSTSYLLDIEKKKRTFQNLNMTYVQCINELMKEKAIVRVNITDMPIMEFWMQMDETDWGMMKRLASGRNACVIANVTTKTPIIDIGMPTDCNEAKDNSMLTIGGLHFTDSADSFIKEIQSSIQGGVLKSTYISGHKDAFEQKRITNEQAAGKMFNGIVQKVEKNKVQVFFPEIDTAYDESGNTWFEYSAAYDGPGGTYGSGIYFMPEIGDCVRVFFPNGDSGEGFAFATDVTYVLDDPRWYSWRAPGGQELLFTPNGIRISGKDNSVFINLMYDNNDEQIGIQIVSDSDVSLCTYPTEGQDDSLIYMNGQEGIVLKAENQIKMKTPETSIIMEKTKITLSAEQICL